MMHAIRKIFLLMLLFFVIMVFVYALLIEPNRILIRHVSIKDDTLSRTLQGKIAVHLSDLHIKHIGNKENQVLQIINDIKPDLIFLTGDYVQWKGNYEGALSFLSRLNAPMGVWAVMGDYDYSASRKSCLFCHESGSGMPTQRHQVRFLRNTLERAACVANQEVWLGGIDPESTLSDSAEIPASFVKDHRPAIILSHTPLLFDSIGRDHAVLILAGDTHGGQVPLPAWLWQIVGYQKNARYSHGFFQDGMKKMYVSRGIGTSHVPLRLLCPPELVVLHF
jgi:predicted MPP superfamily phosphohydrolase